MINAMDDLVIEALFVSDLQPSQRPTADIVRAAVDRMIERYGSAGCAAAVAAEFGDHPETAVQRMGWVRSTLAAA
ncbi:hypothetical protein Val02_77960 [Virgisporangium aliadipatigenens]|uniref:Uncharacterized protein n=1 Tax=Virgisporangium aliadipatigenens TaxID=741659 RepID=A0A8J3YW22_9ACTN|nr:hypothetical protein [Virgisporangium aliadipatigenens]GIJ50910.1 hypothetical protein Val02_77960 [Virgisporangium aliadipatigenens]